jgi:hypothetical protein
MGHDAPVGLRQNGVARKTAIVLPPAGGCSMKLKSLAIAALLLFATAPTFAGPTGGVGSDGATRPPKVEQPKMSVIEALRVKTPKVEASAVTPVAQQPQCVGYGALCGGNQVVPCCPGFTCRYNSFSKYNMCWQPSTGGGGGVVR